MEKELMKALVQARATQLYYHYCHHLVSGESFHEDHAFFSSAYESFEDYYDQLVEYYITLFSNSKFKTSEVSEGVCKLLTNVKVEEMDCTDMYKGAIKVENDFQKCITSVNNKAGLGLQNAVQGMATESDVRLYKMKQRIYESEKE